VTEGVVSRGNATQQGYDKCAHEALLKKVKIDDFLLAREQLSSKG
jgi:hypothetical protein